MANKIGKTEHERFKAGEKLTFKEAILANCYDCNGEHVADDDGKVDCQGKNCSLYQFHPYKGR